MLQIKLSLHHLGVVACKLISLFTKAEAMGVADKVVASPPRGGGFQAKGRSLPRLRPWVTQTKFLLHHLGDVASSSISLFTKEEALDDVKIVSD